MFKLFRRNLFDTVAGHLKPCVVHDDIQMAKFLDCGSDKTLGVVQRTNFASVEKGGFVCLALNVILAATCICLGAAAEVITPYSELPMVLPGD